jgi:hypothetical protein
LGIDSHAGRHAVRLFELICRVNFNIQLDGLDWRALQAQRFGLVAALPADRLGLQGARQRVGVVLEDNHAGQRVEQVDADDGAFAQVGGDGRGGHNVAPVGELQDVFTSADIGSFPF